MLNRRQILFTLAAAPFIGRGAHAQGLGGAKPITVLVPYPAGGPGDLMARGATEFMSERLGRPVVVDFRPGAGGQIAAAALMQQPADGSTLLVAEVSVLCSNKFVYEQFRYDPLTDFEPVAALPQMPMVMFVPKSSPYNSLADIVTASRAKTINYASQGPGTGGHLLGEMLASASGGEFTHVPYKGSAPAMVDTMGGLVDFLFDGIGPGLPYLKAGKLKAIAVAGPKRLPQTPDVPTTAEAGRADLSMAVWFGAVARAGTPQALVQRYNEEMAYAMAQPRNQQRFGDLGFQFVTMSPADFRTFMRRESERWGSFIKARGIKVS